MMSGPTTHSEQQHPMTRRWRTSRQRRCRRGTATTTLVASVAFAAVVAAAVSASPLPVEAFVSSRPKARAAISGGGMMGARSASAAAANSGAAAAATRLSSSSPSSIRMGIDGGGAGRRRSGGGFRRGVKKRLSWRSGSCRPGFSTGGISKRLSPPSRLHLSKKNDNENDPKDDDGSNNNKLAQLIETIKDRLKLILPPVVVEVWTKLLTRFLNIFPTLRTVTLSVLLGATLAVGVIFVPVYQSIDKLTEPVTLFETILSDLDQGYVDDVDTTKLFETGISAMLRSLDPYTEFEGRTEAVELNESVQGRYGGVGLVISGITPKDVEKIQREEQEAERRRPAIINSEGSKLLPQEAIDDNALLNQQDGDISTTRIKMDDDLLDDDIDMDDADDGMSLEEKLAERKALKKARNQGIRVVSAFEGYAYDYGMRVGDKLTAIDSEPITPTTSVEDVRNKLRGEPGTTVSVSFVRDGVEGVNTVSLPRTLVKMRDVKLVTLMGKPEDGIGYIQLSGFAAETGREMRNAILALQRAAEDATGGERTLQGLILDLRGNPGGLLTSAVDVASLLVPKGSDIVSAKGRGFPSVLYRSRVDPILDPAKTKLAVIVNGQTASAAEIVSGAVQDLDVGVIVGQDRTFGKGLVQNVEDLPFDTALKFTVAKYYTPSGRCIQSTNYKEGGGLNAQDGGRYQAKKVADKDKMVFYTNNGREVKDGGGIEADYKIDVPKASALEVTLLRSGVLADFAADWSKKHELTNDFDVDESTYRNFQTFVMDKYKEGEFKIDAMYSKPMDDLKKTLEQSGFKGSRRELDNLRATIVRDIQKDFDTYKKDIKEDITQSILARYLPESMLIERSVKTDGQVQAAVDLLTKNGNKFDQLLARTTQSDSKSGKVGDSSIRTASSFGRVEEDSGARMKVKW